MNGHESSERSNFWIGTSLGASGYNAYHHVMISIRLHPRKISPSRTDLLVFWQPAIVGSIPVVSWLI